MRHVPRLQLGASISFKSTTTAVYRVQPRQCDNVFQVQVSKFGRRWAATSSNLKVLQHLHLEHASPTGLLSYEAAEEAQEHHRAKFLAWKGLPESSSTIHTSPKPLLLSFESLPVFTLGRRQGDLTPDLKTRLERPLQVHLPCRSVPITGEYQPQVKKTNRGGLTTYHGPGQLVLWPILDMHSSLYTKYSVSSYASHLEATTQRLLSEVFGIRTYTSRDEPGVWVETASGQPRKIAALGVHHRRYVTALGTAINIDVPVIGSEDVNPWARFVPCGLEGKSATSVAAELSDVASRQTFDMLDLARRWATLFEQGLVDDSRRGVDLGR